MLEHVRPQYAKKFRCIGNECEDNCCHGWEVGVDKATYQKYQALPALRLLLKEHFVLCNNRGEGHYAVVKQTPSSICPMLLADRLCHIHKEYGPDYLPAICATYPRISRRIDGLPEQPLLLSCPEAARLVLLDPELMPPNGGGAGQQKYSRLQALADQGNPAEGDPQSYLWDIREFSLLLVQDRTYPLWQRLFLLSMFCRRLDAIISKRQIGAVPKLLREYAEIAAQGNLRSAMDGIPVRATAQVKMVMEVALRYLCHPELRFSRIRESLVAFLHGTGYFKAQKPNARPSQDTAETQLATYTRSYVESYDRYYQPFMERHPFLLENYLINHIFRTRFPFSDKPCVGTGGPQQEFLLMCIDFAVIKGLLIGIAGRYREAFGTEQVVKLIYSISRSIEHSQTFSKAVNWQGLADSNSMAALLRN